jgi:hypothetical protein
MARTLIEFIADKINKTANAQPPTKAAAAGGMMPSTNNSGAGMVGLYYSYVEGEARNKAMSMCRQLVERAILWPQCLVACR